MAKGLSGFYAITPVSAASGIFACKRLKNCPGSTYLSLWLGPSSRRNEKKTTRKKTWLQRLDLEVGRNWLEVFNQAFCASWNLW
jgi:hypothetical protein